MGPWARYLAVVVIGIGCYIYLSAPRGSLPWLIGVALLTGHRIAICTP
jgi:hypothetical protein